MALIQSVYDLLLKSLFQKSFGVPASSASRRVTAGPSSSSIIKTAASTVTTSKAIKRPLLAINNNSAEVQKLQAGTSSSKVQKTGTGKGRGRPRKPRDANGNIIRGAIQDKENIVETDDEEEDE